MKETDRELLERIAGTLGECRDSLSWIAEMFDEYLKTKVRDKPKEKELTPEEEEMEKEFFDVDVSPKKTAGDPCRPENRP